MENAFLMSGASESVKEANTQKLLLVETNKLLILALELLSTLVWKVGLLIQKFKDGIYFSFFLEDQSG